MADNFQVFSSAVARQYEAMAQRELFVVEVGDLYASYLAAFPEGTNPIFRERTEHDCNTCKQFLRRLGNLVAFNNAGNRLTVWDGFASLPAPYNVVAETLAGLVRGAPIRTVFRTKEHQYGQEHNYDNETTRRWDHFHGRVGPKHFSAAPDTARGDREAIAQVLRRGLTELSPGDFETVIDLIDGNALYRGAEFRDSVVEFRALQRQYIAAPHPDFVWLNLDNRAARFRNTVIGTLLVDLAEGKDLEQAVKAFESKVAPTNYKRPTALITPRMIEQAMDTLRELGLEGAIDRRYARIDDVSVNNVLFVDNAVRGRMRDGLTDLLLEAARPQAVSVKSATPISGEEFFATVVPSAKSIDVLVENRHLGNFVSLTAPVHADTGRLFKWDNDFAWSYDGEVTDSIKQRVKAAGGKVDARFRVSLAWSNYDDLDLHVSGLGDHIYYASKTGFNTRGQLDVDMNAGGGNSVRGSREPVENVFWNGTIKDGVYHVAVNNFARMETTDVGFTLEVEFDGAVHQFSHPKAVANKATVKALTITIEKGRLVSVVPASPDVTGGVSPTTKWGITTGQLAPVDTLMLSPNHWDGQAIGNKHWFLILKGVKNPDATRGIYNEFLRGDLDRHRKVFEVLGSKAKCPPSDQQLSGVGFSSTRGDEVTVVVDGRRAYNIKF
jgi:hypothetical protein